MGDDAGSDTGGTPGGGAVLWFLVALPVLLGGIRADQPIVENYVGRQIPTAMVARNLGRGSGFLNPLLDVAPFPNRFLVEPPAYAWIASETQRLTGWPLARSGRLASSAGISLGVWGMFGLVARRHGRVNGWLAALLFATFPVTLRYGRAFQPDALMTGAIVAGLSCWDRAEVGRSRAWLGAGFALISAGLALKVLSAYVLIPLVVAVNRRRNARQIGLAVATLVPALLWYAYAATVVSAGGSRASVDNSEHWLRALGPFALLRVATAENIVRFLFTRAFTPVGIPLAVLGLWTSRRETTLWTVWGASALAAMAAVAGKLHHEYYWFSVAPVAASSGALALTWLGGQGRFGPRIAAAVLLVWLGLDVVFAASTWKTPAEWASLETAASVVAAEVPVNSLIAAPEALLFAADRPGCRIEYSKSAAIRAAGEWPDWATFKPGAVDGPETLVGFYAYHDVRYFADVVPAECGPERLALHESIRRRYKILVDRPGVLLAELRPPDDGVPPDHGQKP